MPGTEQPNALDHQENGATRLPPGAPAGILKIYRVYQFPQCPKSSIGGMFSITNSYFS